MLLGDKIVISGNNYEIYLAARDLAQVWAEVIVADVRSRSKVPDYLAKQVKVHLATGIAQVNANKGQVSGVELIDLKSGNKQSVACEVVLSSGGLSPTVHLYCHDTSRPLWDAEKMAFVVPEKYENCKPTVCNVGAVTGAKTWQQTLAQTGDTLQCVGFHHHADQIALIADHGIVHGCAVHRAAVQRKASELIQRVAADDEG